MSNSLIIVLLIIGIALIVFNIWNLISLKRIRRIQKGQENNLNDSKYYELKYKNEFLVAVFSVVVAIVGILGYNSLESAKTEIKSDINKDVSEVDSSLQVAKKELNMNDSIIKIISRKINEYNINLKSNDLKLTNQRGQINQIDDRITEINNKNILKQNYYLIPNLKIDRDVTYENPYRFFFNDLTTNTGDKLPQFQEPPIVYSISELGENVSFANITTTSFDALGAAGFQFGEGDSIIFNIIIMEK